MSLDGKVLDKYLPKRQTKPLDVWYELHYEELKASYYNYNEYGEAIKIKGLEWFVMRPRAVEVKPMENYVLQITFDYS